MHIPRNGPPTTRLRAAARTTNAARYQCGTSKARSGARTASGKRRQCRYISCQNGEASSLSQVACRIKETPAFPVKKVIARLGESPDDKRKILLVGERAEQTELAPIRQVGLDACPVAPG